jgi:hypothetical protein
MSPTPQWVQNICLFSSFILSLSKSAKRQSTTTLFAANAHFLVSFVLSGLALLFSRQFCGALRFENSFLFFLDERQNVLVENGHNVLKFVAHVSSSATKKSKYGLTLNTSFSILYSLVKSYNVEMAIFVIN